MLFFREFMCNFIHILAVMSSDLEKYLFEMYYGLLISLVKSIAQAKVDIDIWLQTNSQ